MKEFFKKLGRKLTGRKGIGDTMTAVIIIAVVMFNVLAYTVTNAFNLYIYSPPKKDLSLSGSTDELFYSALNAEKKVTITFCYPEEKLETHSTGSDVLYTAKLFKEKYPELIELRFINLLTKTDVTEGSERNGERVELKEYTNVVCSHKDENTGKVCGQSSRYIDVKDSGKCKKCGFALDLDKDVQYNFKQNTVIFECGEGEERNYRVLTDGSTSAGFVDFYTLDSSATIVAYNGEEVMASMISWVLHKNHPVAYFTRNHGETADVAFSNLLTSAGYYVEVIDLRKQEIPSDAGMLVISNPTTDFDRATEGSNARGELDKIEDYLMNKGGKLYVAIDPYVKKLDQLEKTLEKWGITLSGDVNDKGIYVRNIVKENSNAITPDGYAFVATHADNELAARIRDKVTQHGKDSVLISEVNQLELDSEKGAQPLLVSSGTSSTHAGGDKMNGDGGYAVSAYSQRKHENGLTSTVLVIPTAYITAADAFQSEAYSNKDFIYSTLEVLFDSNPTPRGCKQVIYTDGILENLTMGKAKLYTAIIFIVPVALAVVGVITIRRRKNR
jgi:hypothetical protein